MSFAAKSGNSRVDSAIATLIKRAEAHFSTLQLGFYLHGSWAAAVARPESDVDILALAMQPVARVQRQEAQQLGEEISELTGVPLDFHLLPLDALIVDPWVDLRRTGRFLSGTDVRAHFPLPTLDALAREAVLISCINVTEIRGKAQLGWPFDHPHPDDYFFGRLADGNPRGLTKSLSWMTSARLASIYGYAPTGAADALQTIQAHDDPFSAWLINAVHCCRQSAAISMNTMEHPNLRTVCEQTLAFENSTFESLHAAITGNGRLGERCAKVIRQYILFPE